MFARESLAEYAAHPLFRTVGIDRSFYGPLGEDELARYAAQLPAGFRCTMKVWSALTARVLEGRFGQAARPGFNPHFLDVDRFAEAVAGPVAAAFRAQLGAFVLEVPPAQGPVNPGGFADAVDRFLGAAPPGFRYAFELRDPRLLTARYVAVLRAHGASHVYNYWTRMRARFVGIFAMFSSLARFLPGRSPAARGSATTSATGFSPSRKACITAQRCSHSERR
ncbi:MAG: DUF72 domain-containing protein [Myxococcota bacterium]